MSLWCPSFWKFPQPFPDFCDLVTLEDYIKLKNEQRENTEYEIEFVYKQETKTIRLEIKK